MDIALSIFEISLPDNYVSATEKFVKTFTDMKTCKEKSESRNMGLDCDFEDERVATKGQLD